MNTNFKNQNSSKKTSLGCNQVPRTTWPFSLEDASWAREITPLVKSLLRKCEALISEVIMSFLCKCADPSLIPQNHIKKPT